MARHVRAGTRGRSPDNPSDVSLTQRQPARGGNSGKAVWAAHSEDVLSRHPGTLNGTTGAGIKQASVSPAGKWDRRAQVLERLVSC